jgi:endonuclease VIII
MPEGPEIRRAADELLAALKGEPLAFVHFTQPSLEPFAPMLVGENVTAIDARGKALLTRFEGGMTMYSHNQLYGVWRVGKPGERADVSRSLRVILENDVASLQLYSATEIEMWPTETVHTHPFVAKLGPDVLDESSTEPAFIDRLRDRRFSGRTLAALLLDQTFAAGMGNYLRSEVLYASGIHPQRRPRDLVDSDVSALATALLDVPRRSYRGRGKKNGPHGEKFRMAVFGRQGRRCERCDDIIVRVTLAGRRLYLCNHCQG